VRTRHKPSGLGVRKSKVNRWSDEQKSYIRLSIVDEFARQNEVQLKEI